jgi:hypothetical protein
MGGYNDFSVAKSFSIYVHELLLKLGFVVAEEKCNWIPAQTSLWLGYCWEMLTGTLHVTDERICRLESVHHG